jgi:hypothetical protein
MEALRPSIVLHLCGAAHVHLLRLGGGFRLVACAAASMPVAPLARARALDLAGDEQDCISTVNEAKSQIGAQ